jgi:hypothetical protein
VHRVSGDGDDLFFDGGGLLDGCRDVGGLHGVAGCTTCHHFGGLSDPKHLLVLAEIAIAAEGLLDDIASHHAQFPALFALRVHATCDGGYFLGGR